jgi:ClpP class serine protease
VGEARNNPSHPLREWKEGNVFIKKSAFVKKLVSDILER